MFLTFCGFLLAAAVGFCLYRTYGRIVLLGTQYRYHYINDPSIVSSSRLSSSPLRRVRRVMPTLLQRASFKEDEARETSCELGRRDD